MAFLAYLLRNLRFGFDVRPLETERMRADFAHPHADCADITMIFVRPTLKRRPRHARRPPSNTNTHNYYTCVWHPI